MLAEMLIDSSDINCAASEKVREMVRTDDSVVERDMLVALPQSGCSLLFLGVGLSRVLKKSAARNGFLSAPPAAFGFGPFGADGMRA